MDKQDSIVTDIIKAVFGDLPVSKDQLQEHLIDMQLLPHPVKSFISDEVFWTSSIGSYAYASQKEVMDGAAKHDWLQPAQDIADYDSFMEMVKKIDFAQASRSWDSLDVNDSDDVTRSEDIFHSQNIMDSKQIVDCSWLWDSEKLWGCVRSGTSTNCIGMIEGVTCSNSYKVLSSHKINNSMFIKNCYDLNECLFCSHLQHKKFCIANMQYDEESYFKLKERILNWLFT